MLQAALAAAGTALVRSGVAQGTGEARIIELTARRFRYEPNEIALNDRARNSVKRTADFDSITIIATDNVSSTCAHEQRRSTDDRSRRKAADTCLVAQVSIACGIGPDIIALDDVAG